MWGGNYNQQITKVNAIFERDTLAFRWAGGDRGVAETQSKHINVSR